MYIDDEYEYPTFTELESLLKHAGMPDLADKVCVWSTQSIRDVALSQPNCTAALHDWFRRWAIE